MMQITVEGAGERWLACVFFGFFLLLVSGCSTFHYQEVLQQEPDQFVLREVPFYPQGEYQCGPAALAMLLAWNGKEVPLPHLIDQVYSPSLQGSLQPSIITAARRQGYLAYPIQGWTALVAELKGGQPVMILQNLGLSWFTRWHYAVVIGYNQHDGTIILHSGTSAAMKMPLRLFERTWRRGENWGLVVLPPSRLPATAQEADFMSAAVGLERAQEYQAARSAYLAALAVWPGSFVGWMGLGNSSYQNKDLEAAIAAFRQAASLQPGNGIPRNNLAIALAEIGQQDEALAVIDQAIALGGGLKEEYLQTRRKILAAATRDK